MKNKAIFILRILLLLVFCIFLIGFIVLSVLFRIHNVEEGNVMKSGYIYGDQSKHGYNAWPSACTANGKIYCTFSGERVAHLQGNGKVMLSVADENTLEWQNKVVYESMYDERDCGILNLGDGKMLLSFITWVRPGKNYYPKYMLSDDYGQTWSDPYEIAVHSPHGPIKLKNGNIVYLGKDFTDKSVHSMISTDGGITWTNGEPLPLPEGVTNDNLCEPYAIELSDGTLFGAVRFIANKSGRYLRNSFFYTRSYDGGKTWTNLKYSGVNGVPPHMLETSDGKLVIAYARRDFPYSLRYKVSTDGGDTFGEEKKLCRQFSWDFGYPSTVELSDGSLLTVYYGKSNLFQIKNHIYYIKWKL